MTTEVAVAIDERVEEMREPYVKALENDREYIKTLYQTKHCTLFYHLTPCGDTVFHIAAYMGSIDLLGDLLGMVAMPRKREVFTMKNSHGNTLLHEVVMSNNVEAAKFLVDEIGHEGRASMLMDRNNLGETALFRAAAFGNKATVEYLVNEVELQNGNLKDDHFTRASDGLSILHIAIMNEKFVTAIWLLDKDPELATRKHRGKTGLQILASMPNAFKSSSSIMYGLEIIYRYIPDNLVYRDEIEQDVPSQSSKSSIRCLTMIKNIRLPKFDDLWLHLAERWNFIKEIWKTKRKHRFAVDLAKILIKMDSCSWREHYNKEGHNNIVCFSGDEETGEPSSLAICVGTAATTEARPDAPLIIAARTGIKEIVAEIINVYPQALEHVSRRGQNILHVAILHCDDILDLIKSKREVVQRRLALGIDDNGDTILHKAACTKYYSGGTKSTAALKLQEGLRWFREVEKMVPPHYTFHRNKQNLTAKQLLEDQYKEQLKEAQDWVKNTCQSCSTVVVLVATVLFAAAFSVPGGFIGYDDAKDGKVNATAGTAVLANEPLYSCFTVMDVAGLASSLTSVVLFLSVLTSSLELEDFHYQITSKLSAGFLFLSFAIAATVFCFTTAVILTFHLDKAWTTGLTYAAAFLPVIVYAIVQFGLYFAYLKSAFMTFISIYMGVMLLLPVILCQIFLELLFE
ncbi:hypothetical protein SLEP1_g47936 [Rubroshorea leprosula]|uniref:PGG domain-containing protein n=1 Tax=Rubroshorea leprosula TaxID=152421 RepID=A0AAV5LTW4_9ROSI|nr:hypothetical protein SLEP1_g47936 [Rubroshorea leprosula]